MINLPNTTLWSCVWSVSDDMVKKHVMVMEHCLRFINFGRAVLFTAVKPDKSTNIESVQIPTLEPKQWDTFVLRCIPPHIRTDRAMCVHEDGFPIDFSMWSNEFMEYDWIGAPWFDGVVGNGGFFMESQKMMMSKVALPFTDPVNPEPSDYMVCRIHRGLLESSGIRFAPTELAGRFSAETNNLSDKTFGFHGRVRAVEKYKEGWRIINEANPQAP